MARKVPRGEAYTHDEATRKNNPEAGMVDYAPVTKETKTAYCWDPRKQVNVSGTHQAWPEFR